jgi:uncharacterized protein (DUF433 family)
MKGENIMWQEFIHSDPNVLVGKPVVKGTRLSVEFILGLFGTGWTLEQVIKNYPTLSPEKVQAVFNFAAECMREESLYVLPPNKAEAKVGNK